MLRFLSLSILSLASAGAHVTALKQRNWYPLEQILSRSDVPSPAAGQSAFGASIALTENSLAIGEAFWEQENISDLGASVHVFHRQKLKLKTGKFWGWKQSIPAGAFQDLGDLYPTVPMDLEDETLALRAPAPEGGLAIYKPDADGGWAISQLFILIDSDPVVPTKVVISGNTMAFSTQSGAVHVLKRAQAGANWSEDHSVPAATVVQGADIALGDGLLAIMKKDAERPMVSHIEIMEQGETGQWTSSGILDLDLGYDAEFTGSSALFAFDGDDLVVLVQQTDFLGNPEGGSLYRYRKGGEAWEKAREFSANTAASSLAVGDGVISIHGWVPDFLGNPTSGTQLMLNRNFRVRPPINHNVSVMSLDGGKIATANLMVDFGFRVNNAKVLIHRNPMKSWFRLR